MPLRPQLQIEVALVRGFADGAVEIELLGRDGAVEFAQPSQRERDIAGAELDLIVEILELALVPHLHGAEIAVLVLADAHAFGMIAVGPERRGPARPDPLVAARGAPLLPGEPLAQGLKQL